ncbi:SMI1/KNR4 family protein [Actinocorallia aurea]
MEFGEFEELPQATRAGRSGSGYPEEITIFACWLASEPDIQRAESLLGVRLPEKYKTFMMRYGGGIRGRGVSLPRPASSGVPGWTC